MTHKHTQFNFYSIVTFAQEKDKFRILITIIKESVIQRGSFLYEDESGYPS